MSGPMPGQLAFGDEQATYPPEPDEEKRRAKEPLLGVVVPRPQGVLWARGAFGDGLCLEAGHPVYVRRLTRVRAGAPEETEAVDVWCCAACWPEGVEA